jgi:hypothetical protein
MRRFERAREVAREQCYRVIGRTRVKLLDAAGLIRHRVSIIAQSVVRLRTRVKRYARRRYALVWHHVELSRIRISNWKTRYGTHTTSVLVFSLLVVTAYKVPTLQSVLEPYFVTSDRLDGLRSLLLTLGGALISADAIAFSLILFAIQVNVDRMPHGLFRKLSTDQSLLGAFFAAFVLAIGVTSLSLVHEKSWLATVVVGASWATILILLLLLYAYRRALSLINPSQQLYFLVNDTRRNMRVWALRAQRAKPLFEQSDNSEMVQVAERQDQFDLERAAFFKLNSHWTREPRQAITHAMSIARRYAEQGDHEVSGTALATVVRINSAYVEAKGRTFSSTNPVFDIQSPTDEFINETLEHLRQNVRIAISRGDEQQIQQTLLIFAALVDVYLGIEYSNEFASKTHATLAAGYLSDAVLSVVPHDMADVVMEGVRLMGRSAHQFLVRAGPNDIALLTEKIGLIACSSIANKKYHPVALTGMEQLARLTFELLRSNNGDIGFALSEIKKSVAFTSRLFLALPDTPLSLLHSTYLGPYYSGTSNQSLLIRLTELANALLEAKADNKAAQTVVRNIVQWAENLHQTEMELLLTAIKNRSSFTSDMTHWIASVTEILLVVSNSDACPNGAQETLQRSAIRLISILSLIPDDKETVTFVENYGLTEILFEAAIDAHSRGGIDISIPIRNLLLDWGFKAGRYHTGWSILERSLSGLAAFVLATDIREHVAWLNVAVSRELTKPNAPDSEIRERTAREMRQRAQDLPHVGHWSSGIDNAVNSADPNRLRPLLESVAGLLSPRDLNGPVAS